MCLATLKSFKTNDKDIGWKVFLRLKETNTNYRSVFFSDADGYEANQEYLCSSDLAITNDDQAYQTGFHIFATEKEAESYKRKLIFYGIEKKLLIIKKVSYKNVIATGLENFIEYRFLCKPREMNLKTIIAKRMKIIP